MSHNYIFTSESVTEGHPDKVCDYIADSILDAYLEQDAEARVACEVLVKEDTVVLAGEITAKTAIDHEAIARTAIREIGYTDCNDKFNAKNVRVVQLFNRQSNEIERGVNAGRSAAKEQGAGDQGIMFGYATNETPELMPLPISLAHKLARALAAARHTNEVEWLRPDAKTQVSVEYENNRPVRVSDVLISTQHTRDITRDKIVAFVGEQLVPQNLNEWFNREIKIQVNPTGSFVLGGPSADCGVTGRKIIVDTYGGTGRHGGGAFSGKDPSKVDRSGAYFCRFVARQIIKQTLAAKAEVQVAYAIGVAQPVSIKVDTFGTGDERAAAEFVKQFDFRPAAIIERLNLLRPIYKQTTNYGHFGKAGLPWEQ